MNHLTQPYFTCVSKHNLDYNFTRRSYSDEVKSVDDSECRHNITSFRLLAEETAPEFRCFPNIALDVSMSRFPAANEGKHRSNVVHHYNAI